MRRFLSDEIPGIGEEVVLDEEVSHHLLKVTRVRRGGRVELFDGLGRLAVAVLVDGPGGRARLRVESVEEVATVGEPLHACLAVTKGPRFETAVRMAVELGVTEIWPVLAKRSEQCRQLYDIVGQICFGHLCRPLLTLVSIP